MLGLDVIGDADVYFSGRRVDPIALTDPMMAQLGAFKSVGLRLPVGIFFNVQNARVMNIRAIHCNIRRIWLTSRIHLWELTV